MQALRGHCLCQLLGGARGLGGTGRGLVVVPGEAGGGEDARDHRHHEEGAHAF